MRIPTTEEVRDLYATSQFTEISPGHLDQVPEEQAMLEFDSWLDQIRAEVWDEGYFAHGYNTSLKYNPYREENDDSE